MLRDIISPMNTLRRRILLWAPVSIYIAIIFNLSSESHPLPALTKLVWDKVLHGAEYAGLAVLFARALSGEGFGLGTSFALAIALTSAYGATDEWHQLFTLGRESDLHDWFADTIGGTLGSLLYSALRRMAPPG
jgi:VanZ family protein